MKNSFEENLSFKENEAKEISIDDLIHQRNRRKKKERTNFINVSKIKDYIKQKNCEISIETLDAINEKVRQIIDEAIFRTRSNKRITVRPYDL